MPTKVKPIPDGYHTVTPYLVVADVPAVIAFVERAFGGEVRYKMTRPDGSVGHAEVTIGDSVVMMGQDPDHPRTGMLHLYVADVDAAYRKALAAGATSVREPTTQFYGDRSGGVDDGHGTQWWIATHVEDVPPDEIDRRAARQG
jgi:PhnB protein